MIETLIKETTQNSNQEGKEFFLSSLNTEQFKNVAAKMTTSALLERKQPLYQKFSKNISDAYKVMSSIKEDLTAMSSLNNLEKIQP